ncbi:MAG: S8 family peptidase [Clostridiales bacterium]|nr:S8 family peptidase [Clostridiales bacterium]
MKLIASILLSLPLCLYAQNKININGLLKIEEIENEAKSRGNADVASQPIEVLAKMAPGWKTSLFDEYNAQVVLTINDEILLVSIPTDRIVAFSESDQVEYVEFGDLMHATMDFALPGSMVSDIQEGFAYNGSNVSFTGKGVVTGLMDEGIDPNHPNFLDAEGNRRVKEAYDFNNGTVATTDRQVKQFTTDDRSATHGTHVAGIMAGYSYVNGSYLYSETSSGRVSKEGSGIIPYYGVATQSDIVMCSGSFTNNNITKGIKNIIAYGESSGQPAVVNLSMGSNNGPHDGSQLLETSLAELGKSAIICISAGNEGDRPMFAGKKFTADDTTLKTFILDNKFCGLDVWTNSSKPVTVSLGLFSAGRFTKVATITEAGQSVTSNSTFAQYADGSVKLISEVNKLNNRFHVQMSGIFTTVTSPRKAAIQIEGEEGQEVFVYGFSSSLNDESIETCFTSEKRSGFTDGTTDGTINGMACANNVIAVGSYNTRVTFPTYGGMMGYNSSYQLEQVSPFSSFGSTYQGVELPYICAPGAAIISSLNRYYTENLSSSALNQKSSALIEDKKMNAYWGQMQGTSMSCPYVSGTVALWLEADPTLGVDDVIDILKKTAVAPLGTSSAIVKKQWGGGRLDALAGIKEVLARKSAAGIDGVVAGAEGYVINRIGDRLFDITVDGAAQVQARLYNLQGVAVASASGDGNSMQFDVEGAAPGIYVLHVSTPNSTPVTRKISLR